MTISADLVARRKDLASGEWLPLKLATATILFQGASDLGRGG